jgi:hypothetical protein
MSAEAEPIRAQARSYELYRWMGEEQRENVQKVATLMGCSVPAAIALQLCREMLRDYCPPDETAKVVAALVGLESKKKAEANAK